MNKYRVKDKAKQATQLILTCIIAGLCFWATYGIVKVFSSSSVPVSVALTGPGHTFEDLDDLLDAIEWVESKMEAPSHTYEDLFDDLLDAIEWVESSGNPNPPLGKDGEVGTFQIKKIYVDEVNRIWISKGFGETYDRFFDYAERDNPALSRQMVTIYLQHYGGTFEEMARKHNGGPTGHKKESTKPYWTKVQTRLMAKEIK